MTVGERIKQVREELRLSQPELALKLRSRRGFSPHPQSVSNWERDLHPPSEMYLEQIAELAGKPVTWFSEDGVAA